jgi:predicted ArsR family transcriptional regulator
MNSNLAASSRRSTPLEILHILKLRGGATVDEMGTALGVTTTAVRQHLTLLEKDGLISSRLLRKGMGRPSRLYGLTDRGDEMFPKGYHSLAADILDEIRSLDGDAKVETILHNRAQRHAQGIAHRLIGKDLRSRVEEMVRILNEVGALAEFEEKDGVFFVREHNCLMYKVATRYPQLCDSEMWLLAQVLDVDVVTRQCFAKGDSACFYELRERTPAGS